MVKCYSFS